ncbi:MAG: NUDIX domain-containing protein [Candidatus Komeilibacteria bacterium]
MTADHFQAPISVHILFLKDKEILLLLRKGISSDGFYGLVAGHLDGMETVTQAMIREANEETGVKILPEDLEISTVCHSYVNRTKSELIQFYAICRKWSGEIKNNEPDKCSEVKFFSLESLPSNTIPFTRDAITKVLSGVKFYEYGWEGED